uniref:Ig-like domain-containing protein n=1 Tax=Leptobrachium leishanense TaxID=445787 RepID=A0A8C5PR67_9ANUR
MKRQLCVILLLKLLSCLCFGLKIQQSNLLVIPAGNFVTLNCTYDDSGYIPMFWYRQRPGEGLMLMIHSTGPNEKDEMEEGFDAWEWSRTKVLESTLKLQKPQPEDSAVYFCAVSKHSHRSQGSAEHKTCSFSTAHRDSSHGSHQHTAPTCRGSPYNIIMYYIIIYISPTDSTAIYNNQWERD